MKKIKLLIINPTSILGGGTYISNNLATGLDKKLFEVFSFFPEKGPLTEQMKKEIKLIFSPESNPFSIIKFLRNFIKKNEIDIIHAQGTRSAFWVKLAYLFLKNRPKLVYTLHGLHIAHRSFWQRYPLLWLERVTNILADELICPSLSVKFLVEKYKIIKRSKIKLIYNGINIPKFSTALSLDKKSLNIPESHLVISAIQRLNFPKDVSTVLHAFKKVQKSFKNIILLIVGSGPLEEKLKKESKENNITESVLFLGDRQDIPNILAVSDIVILSSTFEALGLSLVEAMAAKKPVIGTNVEGIKEIIENGKNGFLVDFGNQEKMAEIILSLLNNSELCKKMGENGFEFVKTKFSLEVMIKNYQNLYNSVLK